MAINDRDKLLSIIESQSWSIGETIKELVDNYEKSETWLSTLLDSFDHVQYQVWYNKTVIDRSRKKNLNYFNLKTKQIHLEDRCFDPKQFVPEAIWLLVHETLHSYFTKWREWIDDFVFDAKKPWFNEIVNIFEDFRINTMSSNFMFYWQEIIKSIHAEYITENKNNFNVPSEEDIKNFKLMYLKNFALSRSIKRIWWTMFDKELQVSYDTADKVEKVFPNECYLIESFLKRMIPQYWTFSIIKSDIRWYFDLFVEDLYNNIYEIVFRELYEKEKEKQQNWNQSWNQWGQKLDQSDSWDSWSWQWQWEWKWEKQEWSSSWNSKWKENWEKESWEDWNPSWKWWWNQEEKEEEWQWNWWNWEPKSFNPFEEEFDWLESFEWNEWDEEQDEQFNEDVIEEVKEKNKEAWKDENSSWWDDSNWDRSWEVSNKEAWRSGWWKFLYKEWNTEYDKIAKKYNQVIWDLYTKLFTVLQKKRDTIKGWFDKWKTVDWNTLIWNKMKILAWQLRNNELFKWSFKRQMKEWKKALNVIALWLDDSWSMQWDPIKILKESSVIISEALRRLSVNYCVDTFTQKIFEWDNSLDYKKIWDIEAWYWNNELKMFKSLKENVEKLIKRSIWFEVVNWLYIFITDWYCYDAERIKEVVKEIYDEWHKIFVIWIFEDWYDKERTTGDFEAIYWKWTFEYLDDVYQLPTALIRIIKDNFQ